MTALGLMIPFAGTALGAAMVYLMKNKTNEALRQILLGFASGIMIAASVWSLLLPAIELSGSIVPYTAGFVFGTVFLLALDKVITRLCARSNATDIGSRTLIMALVVTLHNIPEGMAVGVTMAAAMNKQSGITYTAGLALSVGIAIQNFPEGAIISLPLKAEGASKGKAFLWGALSGAVEPVFGVITLLITGAIVAVLPFMLSFAAGAMIYVVAKELIPESHSSAHADLAQCGLTLGFVVMMLLDVCFG